MATSIYKLDRSPLPMVISAFNRAFENYYVPVLLDEARFAFKSQTEDIDLRLSTGAFEGSELIGFLLRGFRHLDGRPTTYNAGTGVLASHRGQRIVASMYHFIQPFLWEAGVQREQLEVFVQNTPAIRAYESQGFEVQRRLECCKGIPKAVSLPQGYAFEAISPEEVLLRQPDWDCQPTWQFAAQSLLNQPKRNFFLGLRHAGEIVARVVYDPLRSYLMHLYIDPAHRGKGLGASILHHIHRATGEPLQFVNVDEVAGAPLLALGASCGLAPTFSQYEMIWELPQENELE